MPNTDQYVNPQYANLFDKAHQAIVTTGKLNFICNLLPNGKQRGAEYVALNPRRNDKSLGSFRINIYNGKWSDFATSDRGGDLISLYAYVKGITNYEAACEIVGIELPNIGGR